MRIVGGRLRGRALAAPKSQGIRPTADRLRESLFNILAHAYSDPVTGARVLDLFAGTGALGLEAVSRGAAFALFVDDGAEARALLRQNVEALSLAAVTRIFRRDATKLGAAHPVEPFCLVFLDPPYRRGLAEQALVSAREGGWLTDDVLIVVEEATDVDFKLPDGFEEIERRSYDDTQFVFLRRTPIKTAALSDADARLIGACLNAIAAGPFVPDWEFQALMGMTREDCARIAASWPGSDQRDEKVRVAAANAINTLVGYPIDHEDQWARYLPVTREALKGLRDRLARTSLPPK